MRRFAWFFLLLAFSLRADEEATHDLSFKQFPAPWFTGPLIAPSGYTVKPAHVSLQPYLDFYVNTGAYNAHWRSASVPNFYNYNLRINIKTGILSWLDVQLIPQILYKRTQGAGSVGFGDLIFGFNAQLLTYKMEDPWPALKLLIHMVFPTGKYQRLNPAKLRTDMTGKGSWYPELGLVASKLWHIKGIHYLEIRFFNGYQIGTPASVKGVNAYGGDPTTRGTAYPGNMFLSDLAFQYNLTRNWALACDLYYQHSSRSRFSGKTATSSTLPSSEQLSLAPAIEYNFSENIGLIGGLWFSFAGRNYPQFINGVLSLNAYL